jgi:hypothetical protein
MAAEPKMVGDCWQLVVPRQVTQRMQCFLDLMGLEIFPMPLIKDDLPTYGITIKNLQKDSGDA